MQKYFKYCNSICTINRRYYNSFCKSLSQINKIYLKGSLHYKLSEVKYKNWEACLLWRNQ